MPKPRTLFEKIWDAHVVRQEPESPAILYIDLHLIHEVTSPQAFSGLGSRGIKVRRPDRTIATADHSTPTIPVPGGKIEDRMAYADDLCQKQIQRLSENCADHNISYFGLGHPNQGIVHVIGPEAGLTQPGMTIVCGDSHTATHGAFGALAFGIGTSEVEHVLATQCLLQKQPKTYEIRIEGKRSPGITAKDIILAIISKIGVGGGTGCVLEYTGEVIRSLSMEERMTICNMSIEAGARAGLIAPDEKTFAYLKGREFSPSGSAWDTAVEEWRKLPSDIGAEYDKHFLLDISDLAPMITFGTNPAMGIPIDEPIPDPDTISNPEEKQALQKALGYMDLKPGKSLIDHPLDVVFIGSCTNSRISDLRQAAQILKGNKVSSGLRALVVPGSNKVKNLAEEEGLDIIFKDAGAEWREPGCSMCIAMNGDQLEPGQYAISTSNRNFEGRQGKNGRTFLASPATAAASMINGKVTDPREYVDQ